MPGSDATINYAVRIGKQIERKMLCDAFRELAWFHPLSKYQYVGMGAVYFQDFIMVHRGLGINSMFSLQGDGDRRRYQWNAPFSVVELLAKWTWEALPDIPRDRPTIAWLDYDYRLVPSVLRDIAIFLRRAQRGDLLVVTVDAEDKRLTEQADPQAQMGSGRDDEHPDAVERLRAEFPEAAALEGVVAEQLKDWRVAEIYEELFDGHLQDISGDIPNGLRFQKIFSFQYRDSARMLTLGGVVVGTHEEIALAGKPFDPTRLPFIRGSGDPPFKIEVPSLTHREIRGIDQYLPGKLAPFRAVPVSDDMQEQYRKLYRWYPAYAESDL